MIRIPEEILEKHKVGLEAAYRYYVLSERTGLSDSYYDFLESEARKDGLELRDYVRQGLQGKRSMNADYIKKVEKLQVTGNMKEAFTDYIKEVPEIKYEIPKYDGSSLAAYYDFDTGECMRVITIGGSNLGSEGIDQTEKFAKFFPNLQGTGIYALQCECLVSLEHGFGESSRQKANGLVNSSYQPLSYSDFLGGSDSVRTEKDYQVYLDKFYKNLEKVKSEIDKYINIRCFRFYSTEPRDYKKTIESLPRVYNESGDIKFSGGFVFTESEFGDFMNSDIWSTPTGTFLVDGVVGYSSDGVCIKALKYKDAGRGETTVVQGIKWNNQVLKGKDSWSANAVIDPITIRGSVVRKPTVGSIKKMVERGLSKGARVTIILANSTIPQVSEVKSPGNGDYEWPTCSCGYRMSEKDIYGTVLKCGNPECTERYTRMKKYLDGCKDWGYIDLNKLMVLDRFDWTKKTDYGVVLGDLFKIFQESKSLKEFHDYLEAYLTTENQMKNLDLVFRPVYRALEEYYEKLYRGNN